MNYYKAVYLILLSVAFIERISCSENGSEVADTLLDSGRSEEGIIANLTLNTTESQTEVNVTENSVSANSNTTFKIPCLIDDNATDITPVVEIVNSTKLSLILLNQTKANVTAHQPAACLVAFFYSPSCPFSCMAAPHFNALPRAFPKLKMVAVDTSTRYNLNTQFGIVGVPSLLIFHNARLAARFNSSSQYTIEYFARFINQNGASQNYKLESFIGFITKNTGLQPEGDLLVTSDDFAGPVSSIPIKQTDFALILSWLFVIVCIVYYFYYSSWCKCLVDGVRNAWREAEDQHAHND